MVETAGMLVAGNTGMWLLAGVAGGLLWGWPAVVVIIKPFVAPFALLGANKRGWWVGVAVATLLSIPLIGQWLVYPAVVLNAHSMAYSPVLMAPLLLVPVWAWVGRTNSAYRRTASELEVRDDRVVRRFPLFKGINPRRAGLLG